MTQADAMVLREGLPTFIKEKIVVSAPQKDEVLIRTKAVGICHTDLNILHGNFPYPKPCVLGHEGAGIVEEIGEDVEGLKIGDHVVLTFNSCGSCYQCEHDHPAFCPDMPALNFAGVRPDGTPTLSGKEGMVHGSFFSQSSFATYCIAGRRNVVKVPSDVPFDILAPLGCGVQTGAGTVLNVLKPGKGQSIAVLGVGTVGMAAVMAAKISGCAQIIAVDRTASRLELAKELGATHVIDVTKEDVSERLTSLGGVDFCMDTTGHPAVIEAAVMQLHLNGALALVGFSDPTASIPVNLMHMTFGRTIVGVIEGDSNPEAFIPKLVEYWRRGEFPYERLIRRYDFEDINVAVQDMESGEAIKPVLVFD